METLAEKREVISNDLKTKYGRFLLTQKEAREELGITENTIVKIRKTGELPSRKIAGKIVVNVLDLAEFMTKTV